MTSSSTPLSSASSLTKPLEGADSRAVAVITAGYGSGAPTRCPVTGRDVHTVETLPARAVTMGPDRSPSRGALVSENVPDEIEPDAEADAALEPDAEFGEQDETAQADEWEEDAREGGE